MKARIHKAIYPGSFDPPTLGHLDVLVRARRMFDEIVVAVGCNPDKSAFFEAGLRVEMMTQLVSELVAANPDGAPVTVAYYEGLTVDFAREVEATVIIRGIRNTTDLHAECQLAITNRQVADRGGYTLFTRSGLKVVPKPRQSACLSPGTKQTTTPRAACDATHSTHAMCVHFKPQPARVGRSALLWLQARPIH